ncbi:MAG: hypothetical protein LQ341_001870 [Variospora aurantia]|nr:MAG: hypothetical protein LQ341_001870 [Variospora aurantia]
MAYPIATAVNTQICGQGDAANQEEKGVDRVEDKHGNRDREAFHDGGADQVEQGEQGEDGDKDDIVDDGVVAAVGFLYRVADECHDENGHEELVGTKSACARPRANPREFATTNLEAPEGDLHDLHALPKRSKINCREMKAV